MQKFLAVFVALIFTLSACNKTNTGKDGYQFGQKQYEMNHVTIDVVVHKTQQEMTQAALLHDPFLANPNSVAAFSIIYKAPNNDKCIIHMIDPSISYQPEFIGHEFLHCVYGQWHTDNNSLK